MNTATAMILSSKTMRMYTPLLVLTLFLMAGGFNGCTSIPTGMGGIEWTPTQGTLKQPLGEGWHLVSPLSTIYQIDLREEERLESLEVLTNNGLALRLNTSILFQPIAEELYQLLTETGPNFYNVLISPVVRSSARRVVGRYSPEEIYSTKREEAERELGQEVTRKIQGKHVRVTAVLIREVQLPKIVQDAIQRKLEQEQKALEMEFVLDRERKEAERKRIEAAGIADSHQIINKGLTDKLLEWRGIEATEKLALSPNSKTIVIGSGKGGLPVILNPAGSTP